MASFRTRPQPTTISPRTGDAGFLLIGAIVMIALVLIVLAIAAPIVARDLRREKDVEAVHRGNQYVRAIQVYYRKFGRYPGSVEQLKNTNNIRFLRQQYIDPITGKDDFTIIPVGQNKTTVKTFFGAPLAGLPGTGVGSIGSMLSPGIGIGANSAAPGSTTVSATGSTTPASAGAGTTATSATGTSSMSSTGTANPAASGFGGSSSSFGSSSSSSSPGSPGGGLSQPFMGVALGAKGDSIIELNEQTNYGTWEFLYDPRLDQLKARAAALNGGGPGSAPGSSLGQPSMPTGLTAPSSTAPGGAATPAAPTTSPTTGP